MADAQLVAMAQAMGVKPPPGGSWMEQFQFVCDQLQQAVMICDVTVPGMKVQYTNPAGERLVGYSKAEHVGKNCRFMQGKRTEAAAVRQMVKGIRDATPVTVKVTNYKKDGTQFVNVLTLHPVKDSAGVYRYQIGVQSDGARAAQEGAALDQLRSVLPTMFDAKAQPKKFDESLTAVDDAAQRKQWQASMVKFTRLVWSMDWETSLRQLLSQQLAQEAFGAWVQQNSQADMAHLQLLVGALMIDRMDPQQGAQAAAQMCQQMLGKTPSTPEEALQLVRQQGASAQQLLASDVFPKFVQSKACLPLVEKLLGENAKNMEKADDLIWDKYTVPADCAGWIHSFVMVAETHPACIVISDMQVPGNPMFFVNQEFCKITGYAKREVQGRNCRFLQGPQTEAQSVAVIQDTLRRGVDCHVKLTNYRKNGDLFENLLTMRPVHDSNGVMRFCIGVQFEVNRDTSLKSRLMKLDKLLKLLPSTLEVSSKAVGETHIKEENNEEKAAALETKLESALEGKTVGAPPPDAYVIPDDSSGSYADNREDLLEGIGVSLAPQAHRDHVTKAVPLWAPLHKLVGETKEGPGKPTPMNTASHHPYAVRIEAARKLLLNHEAVLRDTCNPSADKNINGNPLTQRELRRVPVELCPFVDQVLREAIRLLILPDGQPGVDQLAEKLDPSQPAQLAAWAMGARFIVRRIQGSDMEMPGRPADMSTSTATAMRAALQDVGGWMPLMMLASAGGGQPEGAAAAHSNEARQEAAQRLIANHANVLRDIANPSADKNIIGIPLTQLHLKRVPAEHAHFADQALREVVRRLLGGRPGTEYMQEHLDPTTPAQAAAWAQTAKYLDGRIQDQPDQKPGRQPDMSAAAGAAVRAVLAEVGAIGEAGAWGPLYQLMNQPGGDNAMGAAAAHPKAAREEAARNLISNHINVVNDVANASPDKNIIGIPLTQLELRRVPAEHARFVDQALREVARRLLGNRQGTEQLEQRLDPSTPLQANVWAQTVKYLEGRIHDKPEQKPGRTPDMSTAAGAAMKAVMAEVGMGARALLWGYLQQMISSGARNEADGVAAFHSAQARQEAASKLIANHENVLNDVANASPTKNIIGVPLTQLDLRRVSAADACYADQAMRETVRRLIGKIPETEFLEEKLEHTMPAQMAAWARTTKYLCGRIQDRPEQKSGRAPDMSAAAGAAAKAVLAEVGGWASLKALLKVDGSASAIGAASGHSLEAREEAARKLIHNHGNVLKDVANPSPDKNIIGIPLTQLELQRVPPQHAVYADQLLREICRRLLGMRAGSELIEERLDAMNPEQAAVWAHAVRYLGGRIQESPAMKPGRTPDMSAGAGAAMKAVLKELFELASMSPWQRLQKLHGMPALPNSVPVGAAAYFAPEARIEAATKLISNHENVLKDVANPSPDKNIIGIPLTQTELKRVPAQHAHYADQALREAVRRLLGPRVGSQQLEEHFNPFNPEQAVAWAQTAKYLEGRIHDKREQKPDREPDMSTAAGAAMKAVLRDFGSWAPFYVLLDHTSGEQGVDGAAAGHSAAAREEAARKLIGNHTNVLRDVANPSADKNIIGIPLTQLDLDRVPWEDAGYADQLMREVTRRLLGKRPGSDQVEEKIDSSSPRQGMMWAQAAKYLDGRIQGSPGEKAGREPDLSAEAAAAMRAVLAEVGKPPAPAGGGGMNFFSALSSSPGGMFGGGMFGGAALPAPTGVPSPFATGAPAPFAAAPVAPPAQPTNMFGAPTPASMPPSMPPSMPAALPMPLSPAPSGFSMVGGAPKSPMGAGSSWEGLHKLLSNGDNGLVDGLAAAHSVEAREEAASKLIGNHDNVLKDVANPSPTSNIIGIPLTQAELRRVPAAHARYADQAMREAVRRLLGRRPGSEQMQEHVDPAAPGQAVAWALTAKYLIGRIQDRPQQKPGRQPDMSAAAGAAMKDVLSEIGDLVRDQTWGQLRAMHVNGAAQMAQGAAGGHAPAAREEAARKLLFNHENVLMDVANPSKTKNIIGIPLTQTELRRVSAADAVYADQIMRETVRRLLGNHPGSEQFEEKLDPSTPAQAVAWAQTAKYLEGRIHDRPEQKPGRAPDMSAQAGAAMKAVLAELGGAAAAQSWAQLSQLLQSGGGSEADGAAAAHSAVAREEAARKLIGNHENVLKDVANPSPDKNIIGIPLTQLELKRVSAADACYADQMMRELVRRLLGRRPGSESLEERLDPSLPAQAVAWAKACKYLEGRIHDRPEQKPDRSPDMSAAAGAATKAVLAELMLAAGSQRWYYLQLLNDSARGAEADGAAGAHSAAAREEAAQKLLTNHVNVMKDVANASPSTNIDGIALTQLELRRVPSSDICYVDQALREIVRRLLGNRPGTEELREHLEPWAPAQAQTWAHTAKYLEGRIHDRAQQKAGRQPDMSTAAGAAMKAVLAEMAAHARQHSWGQLLTLEASSGGTEAEGAAAGHSFEARSEAAVRLINNHENVLKDVANASPDRNIVGVPLTQLELSRVLPQDAVYADQLMREVVRRLLGKRAGSHLLEERLDPAVPEQMAAWAQAAKYLVGRIHDRPDQKPGRAPDMSSAAGAAMKDVLSEVGCWTPLHLLLQAGGGAEATGAAASHSCEARTEAAYRLIANHVNVLKDVANPSPDKNIIGIPLTQTELRRVDASDACYADQAMREVVRRLLGRRRGIEQLEERLNPSIKGQAAAWAQTAKYLEGRIQDRPEQKPGRQPDMSAAAGAAVKAVLAEIGALSHMSVRSVASTNEVSGGSNEWTPLQQLMQTGAVNEGVGCASAFSPHARKEAAHKLISNHTRVLRDLTNPSTSQNIEGLPLTQLELKRVSPEDSRYVDQMLREVARRLLGGPAQLEERLSATVPAQMAAWAKASRYLVGRIQSTPQQRPGREPDMSAEAGEAMKAVVLDAGGWSPLQALLDSGTSAEADGAAAAHAAAAREEAARKLIQNHFNVIKDVANPSPDKNIIGIPLTQLELKRVPAEHAHYADQALREAVRRLLGRRPGADLLEEKLDPETATQGAAWALTAKYLNGRIQDQPDQKPGREPDMSAAAGAAVKAVLNEISGVAANAGGGYVNSPPDPQLCVMAQTMGVRPPTGGAWMDQFQFVCDQLQQAVMICDVTVPGMKVQYTNPAGERLVGYSKAEHVGKNCRFMQGKRTEAAAVRQMVKGIRDATPVTVKVTNYKKDGTQFVNVLTLHPVKDSAGVYRYQIGVQSDGACASQEGPALDKLRSVLPTMFDAAAQPKKFTETLASVDDAAQRKQWRASMAKFTRLVWSMDWETSLRRLLTQPIGQMAFQQWLQNNATQDVPALELYMEASALDAMETNDAEEEAIHLCDTLMGQRHGDGANALSSLRAQAAQMIQALAADSFPKFVQSKQCLPLVEQLLKNERRMKTVDELIWDKYTVPADCAGWIHSFVMVAETYPACIVISDMQVPGNPMFFVNQEFCKITGYAKREVQGRNCRFLQGPQTEAQSVAVIQDTLRRGVDCHVKLTNYRKNGDLFENLLTMRPVHDSNGVMRFCIGVQFEVNRDTSLKSRLMKLDKLLKLLPSTLEVSSRAVGEVHSKEENNEEKSAALESKLDQALAGATVGAPKNNEYHIPADTNDYYGANREDLLRSLGVDPNSKIENYKGDPNAPGAFAVGSGANAAFASKQFDMTGLPPVSPTKIPA